MSEKQLASDEPLPTVTVRIRVDLARKIRTMCASRTGLAGQKQAVVDYLDRHLRSRVEADFEEFVRRLKTEQHGSVEDPSDPP